jgi:hypothetical protein
MTSTDAWEFEPIGEFDDLESIDPDGEQLDLAERHALRRVPGLSTELLDVTEVEYRKLRLERVVLIGVWTSGTSAAEAESSMRELRRLAETAGALVLDGFAQRRDRPDPATYVGSGKAKALREVIAATGADTLICDGELTPGQLVQLENVVKVKVIDRTSTSSPSTRSPARARRRSNWPSCSTCCPGCAVGASRCPGRAAVGWPAARASAAEVPARPRSRPIDAGSGPALPSCAARSPRWGRRGRPNALNVAGTRSPRWRSSGTRTPASRRC